MKLAVAALLIASPLAAQDVPPPRIPMSLVAPLAIDARLVPLARPARIEPLGPGDSRVSQATRARGRYGAGLIGFGVGAAAGFGVAAAAGPYDCACEDPGLNQAVLGVAIGGVLGAGIGAALPKSDVAGCARGARIGRGLLGAVAGSAVLSGVGALVHPLVAVFSFPFTTPFGASYALRRCR